MEISNQQISNGAQPLVPRLAQEAIASCKKLESDFRNMGDYCQNNIGAKTHEDWERMDKFLVRAADAMQSIRIRVESLSIMANQNQPVGNAAAIRAMLEQINERFWEDGLGRHHARLNEYWKQKIEEALSEPPRNCDKFVNMHDAWIAWQAYCAENFGKETMKFHVWLYANEKGETDGSK